MVQSENISSRPRGRPEKSADERKQVKRKIAETAQKLFQEEGYATVSMRRLAREVGCSPMTLYKYYDGKIAILQTLWAVVFRELFAEIEKQLGKAVDPKKRLAIASRHYVRYWLEHPEHYRLVFMAEGVTQPEVSMFVDSPEIVKGFGLLARTIADVAGGPPNQPDVEVKIDLVMSALHGMAHNKITISGYPWSGEEAMIDQLIDNIA